jgi:hypothetical protein
LVVEAVGQGDSLIEEGLRLLALGLDRVMLASYGGQAQIGGFSGMRRAVLGSCTGPRRKSTAERSFGPGLSWHLSSGETFPQLFPTFRWKKAPHNIFCLRSG